MARYRCSNRMIRTLLCDFHALPDNGDSQRVGCVERGLSMRVLFVIGCGLAGLVIGALLGFVVALIAMSFSPSRTDGTFGMREMIVCLPSGALLGLLAASSWALMANHAAG
jgi:hypothetical protein